MEDLIKELKGELMRCKILKEKRGGIFWEKKFVEEIKEANDERGDNEVWIKWNMDQINLKRFEEGYRKKLSRGIKVVNMKSVFLDVVRKIIGIMERISEESTDGDTNYIG